LDFTGSTFEGDSVSVPVIADVNYPGAPGAPAANGDTAYTLIIMDGNAVRTYWLTQGARDTTDAWYRVTTPNPNGSIVDVLNLPPDILSVGGSAVIQGEGVVQAVAAIVQAIATAGLRFCEDVDRGSVFLASKIARHTAG
ncbi:MAG: hypothetical protein IH912_10550, partial [Proteobacteria bacterium]|nr:hypothetical protein [Pseudomonadota bacterium]